MENGSLDSGWDHTPHRWFSKGSFWVNGSRWSSSEPRIRSGSSPIDFAEFAHACGGLGFTFEDPGDCNRAMTEFLDTPGPALLQAVVDPFEPSLPAKVKAEQALHFAESLARGEPRKKIALTALSDKVRELI